MRSLIVISGYYGFDNLGDEAILEQLISEVRAAQVNPADIVVLSNNPEATSAKFGVRSVNRWKMAQIIPLLSATRLFISGGGGLFQDTASIKSIVYYGSLLALARTMGAKTLIYAQGIGPLKHSYSQTLTGAFFQFAQQISVRDEKSFQQLLAWGLADRSVKTADPVWALKQSALPQNALAQLQQTDKELVGLSLRAGGGFTSAHVKNLVQALTPVFADAILVMLPLQEEQDLAILKEFAQLWPGQVVWLNSELTLPSQWLALLSNLDMVVGMRLHSLIMALASGKAVIGISYDTKVEIVLNQFQQPNLSFKHDQESKDEVESWQTIAENAHANKENLAQTAARHAAQARETACQNGTLIAKILAS